MQNLRLAAVALVVVGALNWGLVGLFGVNLVAMVLGIVPMLERIVYVLVALAGVFLLASPDTWKRPAAMA